MMDQNSDNRFSTGGPLNQLGNHRPIGHQVQGGHHGGMQGSDRRLIVTL